MATILLLLIPLEQSYVILHSLFVLGSFFVSGVDFSLFSNTTSPCNCRVKASCPLKGKGREKCIIYKATLTPDDSIMHCLCSCETEFKARFYNHSQSYKCQRKSNAIELSKAFRFDKTNGKSPQITWEVVTETTPHQLGVWACMLCLTEKCAILQAHPATSLNKRTELMGKYRLTNKFKLKNFSLYQHFFRSRASLKL